MPRSSNRSENRGRTPVGRCTPRKRPCSSTPAAKSNRKASCRVDDVLLHAEHLGDVGDPAGAVAEPLDLHDQVDGRGDLLADRPQRQVHAGHQHQRLQPGDAVARRVGVQGGERAVVAGVHRLQHVERLAAAALADDDPVGPHAQGVAHQVADGDLARALDVGRPRLQRDDVLLLELQLGRVLDGDDALVVGDEAREHVEQRRLAGAGAAGDEDVQPRLDRRRAGARRSAGSSSRTRSGRRR